MSPRRALAAKTVVSFLVLLFLACPLCWRQGDWRQVDDFRVGSWPPLATIPEAAPDLDDAVSKSLSREYFGMLPSLRPWPAMYQPRPYEAKVTIERPEGSFRMTSFWYEPIYFGYLVQLAIGLGILRAVLKLRSDEPPRDARPDF